MSDRPQLHRSETIAPTDLNASQLLARMFAKHRQRIVDNLEGCVIGDDPEHLHRMRTSTRRLRSALRLCRGVMPKRDRKALERELSWLARALGHVRDLDVMILELPRLLAPAGVEAQPSLDGLLNWLQRQQAEARIPLLPVLDSPRFEALVAALTAAAEPAHSGRKAGLSAADLLQPRLAAHLDQLWELVADISPDSPDEQLHRLRIFNKRLRYGCELAQPVLPLAPFAPTLRIPHDLLGEHQDASVASEWVERFEAYSEEIPAQRVQAWQDALSRERLRLRQAFLERLPALIATLGEPSRPAPGTLAAVLNV